MCFSCLVLCGSKYSFSGRQCAWVQSPVRWNHTWKVICFILFETWVKYQEISREQSIATSFIFLIFYIMTSCHQSMDYKVSILIFYLLPSRIWWCHLFRPPSSNNLLWGLPKFLIPICWQLITFFDNSFSIILSTCYFHFVLFSSIHWPPPHSQILALSDPKIPILNSKEFNCYKSYSVIIILITYFCTVVPLTSGISFPVGLLSLTRHFQQVL